MVVNGLEFGELNSVQPEPETVIHSNPASADPNERYVAPFACTLTRTVSLLLVLRPTTRIL